LSVICCRFPHYKLEPFSTTAIQSHLPLLVLLPTRQTEAAHTNSSDIHPSHLRSGPSVASSLAYPSHSSTSRRYRLCTVDRTYLLLYPPTYSYQRYSLSTCTCTVVERDTEIHVQRCRHLHDHDDDDALQTKTEPVATTLIKRQFHTRQHAHTARTHRSHAPQSLTSSQLTSS
jgi:hypothetical protein